jgi:DNA-directed RNA polymerase subunit RPC12/RpoP
VTRPGDTERRLRALERAVDLPRYVVARECAQCGYDVVELRGRAIRKTDTCPQCGSRALFHSRRIPWPPETSA